MALTVAGLVSDVGSMMLRWELVMLTVLLACGVEAWDKGNMRNMT